MFESLIRRMTKPQVPKSFIKNSTTRNTITSFRRQRKLSSLVRVDWINTILTPALVKCFPYGQSLNGNNVFIKIAPTVIVMIDFMD